MDEIADLAPNLPGSVVAPHDRVRGPGCHCHAKPTLRLGPHRLLTGKLAGKTGPRTVIAEQEARYLPWLEPKRCLGKLEQLNFVEMATIERCRRPDAPRPPSRSARHRGGIRGRELGADTDHVA